MGLDPVFKMPVNSLAASTIESKTASMPLPTGPKLHWTKLALNWTAKLQLEIVQYHNRDSGYSIISVVIIAFKFQIYHDGA
jgi:hypothetical protein